jgi:hypothetical protein
MIRSWRRQSGGANGEGDREHDGEGRQVKH